MYFGINPDRPGLGEALEVEFTTLLATPDMRLYALLDCAFDEPLGRAFERNGVRLYDATPMASIREVGPLLICLPHLPEARTRSVRRLIDNCTGRPMLSWLMSRCSADELHRHLAPFLLALTPDGLQWPLRLADTRIVPALLDCLYPPQRERLLAPLKAWWITDRMGEMQRVASGEAKLATVKGEPLLLDERQFTQLVERAEADAVLAQIAREQPQVLAGKAPADCHATTQAHLSKADAYGMEDHASRLALCVLGLTLPPGFEALAPMAEVLGKVRRERAVFVREVADLPASFWEAQRG